MVKKKKVLKKEQKESNLLSVVSALESVKNNTVVKNIDLFENDFQNIIDRLLDDSFRLAVVGEFSSGKSTFLNVLIGKDLLKHGAKETTATITEIHNKNNVDDKTYLDVYFRNGDIIRNVLEDKITEYTATASTTLAVAKEIDKVVINSNILDTDSKICFVDTPGLNGIADNHREQTIEQIKNAHACIYLIQVRGLGQSDIDFLKYIIQYQHNIIFVQNFIDELKRLEGETPEQKIEEQRKIIEKHIISENKNVHYEIIAVSARKALIAKSYDFKEYNGEILSKEMRERLYKESRFEDVFSVIHKLMMHNEKGKIQHKDAVSVALNLLGQLKKVVSFKNEKEIADWERTTEGRNSVNYTKLIDSLMANKDGYIKKLEDYIESETSEIRKENKKKIEIGVQEIEECINNIFSDISVISEFENYMKNNLSAYLNESLTTLDKAVMKHMNIKFENMVANAVLRIRQYTGIEVKSIKPDSFESTVLELNMKNFTQEEDQITKLQRDLFEKQALNKKVDKDIEKRKEEILRINSEIETQSEEEKKIDLNKETEIKRLGPKPAKETKYRIETYYEDRHGLLGRIFLGPKERTTSVPYFDDSKQKKWEKQKNEIENQYKMKKHQIDTQYHMLEIKKKQCDEEIQYLEKIKDVRKKDIQSTKRLLAIQIEYLNKQREKVRQEYLREAKKSVLKNIHEYLDEYSLEILYENNEIAIEENCKKVNQVVKSLFMVSFENRICSLQQQLGKINGTRDFENTSDLLTIINKATIKLEEFLCQ